MNKERKTEKDDRLQPNYFMERWLIEHDNMGEQACINSSVVTLINKHMDR